MISLLVFALCVMGVARASLLDLIHDSKCRDTVLDIPGVMPENGNYLPEDLGHFYQYGFRHSNDDLNPADIRCSEFDYNEEKPSRIQDGHSYIYNYTYFNITSKKREGNPPDSQYFTLFKDEAGYYFVNIDKDGHIKANPMAGRHIVKKLSSKNNLYYVVSGFDQTLDHCQLWWQIYGHSKDFSDEEFKKALLVVESSYLPYDNYYRIKHDDC